jgi:hypothetical protein
MLPSAETCRMISHPLSKLEYAKHMFNIYLMLTTRFQLQFCFTRRGMRDQLKVLNAEEPF